MNKKQARKKIQQKKKKIQASRRKGDDFRLKENWPTIGEAKDILVKELKKRGFKKINNIKYSHKHEYFIITFDLQKNKNDGINQTIGCGPSGMEKVKYSWNTVLDLYEK